VGCVVWRRGLGGCEVRVSWARYEIGSGIRV
jgi:hypothetical protein